MGEPIRITELAEQIIKFSGLEPYRDIDIKIIGKRKGERETECLWSNEESVEKTDFPKILRLTHSHDDKKSLCSLLDRLRPVCVFSEKSEEKKLFRNKEYLVRLLCEYIPSLQEFYGERSK